MNVHSVREASKPPDATGARRRLEAPLRRRRAGSVVLALADLVERSRWLEEAAGDRHDEIERSALVQFTRVGDDAPTAADLADRFHLPADIVADAPFALFGSLEQVVDKIERQRETLGITHYVVRDPDGFAPVVDALTA